MFASKLKTAYKYTIKITFTKTSHLSQNGIDNLAVFVNVVELKYFADFVTCNPHKRHC